MDITQILNERSSSKCELCGAKSPENIHEVTPSNGTAEQAALLCDICLEQITDPGKLEPNHWHCLNESMWSTVPAVQVMAYRMLKKISHETWAQDLLEMLYLDPELQRWAEAEVETDHSNLVPGKDSNGAILNAGDNATLIKDLEVKGAGFTAKRGTMVRGISLTDTPDLIEGRINGVRIVLKTCFLKKA